MTTEPVFVFIYLGRQSMMYPMKYQLLGKSGLIVSELCLGAMTFGEEWGLGASKEECHKIFNAYVDAGRNFIDTANNYMQGTNMASLKEMLQSLQEQHMQCHRAPVPFGRQIREREEINELNTCYSC